MILKDKVAVITGAGRGIGRETALLFAREGARLAIVSRHRETIDPVAAEAVALGAEVMAEVVDVSSEAEVEAFCAKAYEKFGKVDILVNNAGLNRDNFFLRLKTEEWDDVIAVNLKGAFLCSRIFSRRMMRQKSGRIINLSSIAGEAGNMGQANYSAAKAGVIGLSKSAAKELARYGITVNVVSPGLIETDMLSEMEPKVLDDLRATIPLGRLGSPADVAQSILFLASAAAAYITGAVLRVDGGMYM